MVVELPQEGRVALEQRPGPAPAVQQPADPDPGQQAHAELDAAGPVDAGQERVGRPPGAELGGGGLGVALIAAEAVGGGQHGEVLVAGRLPNVLDVADHGRVAEVDVEAVGPVRGPPAGAGVKEPVRGRRHVVAGVGEHLPAPGEQPLGGLLEPDPGLLGDVVGAAGEGGGEVRGGRQRGRVGAGVGDLPAPPAALGQLVAGPAGHLRRRHAGQSPRVPAEVHRPSAGAWPRRAGHGLQAGLARLRRAAKVARVVATSDASGTGMARASATARTNASSSWRWPLSMPGGSGGPGGGRRATARCAGSCRAGPPCRPR